jgi:hypothetical protein
MRDGSVEKLMALQMVWIVKPDRPFPPSAHRIRGVENPASFVVSAWVRDCRRAVPALGHAGWFDEQEPRRFFYTGNVKEAWVPSPAYVEWAERGDDRGTFGW